MSKQSANYSLVLVVVGLFGMLFFLTNDIVHHTLTKFGVRQLAGLTVSGILTMAGIGKLLLAESRMWNLALLVLYFAGVIFMGLRPEGNNLNPKYELLMSTGFDNLPDMLINIFGFFPLGYLMMSYILSGEGLKRKYVSIVVTFHLILGISLFIEVLQSTIPGRTSSITDIITNGFGALCGMIYSLLESGIYKKSTTTRNL